LKMMADMCSDNEDPEDQLMYMRWIARIRRGDTEATRLQAEVERLKAEQKTLTDANHRQAMCIHSTAQAMGPDVAAAVSALPKAAQHLQSELTKARELISAMTKGFNTLEQANGKYSINMRFEHRDDAWSAYGKLGEFNERYLRSALATKGSCNTCGGTKLVSDGELLCSSGGIPYEMGPIKCVKDCPDCAPVAKDGE
jgi:hypothetical protein